MHDFPKLLGGQGFHGPEMGKQSFSKSCSSRHFLSHVSLLPYALQCSPGRWAELRMTSWLSDLQLARDWWGLPLGLDLRILNPLPTHLLLGLLPDNLLLPSPLLSSQIPQPGVLYASWSPGNSFTTCQEFTAIWKTPHRSLEWWQFPPLLIK